MDYVVLYRAHHDGFEYIIYKEGEDPLGYFLWVLNSDDDDVDELYGSSVEVCQVIALERYGIALSNWKPE